MLLLNRIHALILQSADYLKIIWFGDSGISSDTIGICWAFDPWWKSFMIFCPTYRTLAKEVRKTLIQGIPLTWWHSEVTLLSHIMQKNGFFQLLPQSAHKFLGSSVTKSNISMPVIGGLSLSRLSLFRKFCFKFTTIVPCSRCDIAMSSGERFSQNLGSPQLIYFVSLCCNISAMAGQNLMKISHHGEKPFRF